MKKLDLFEILLIVVVMGIGLYAALSDPQNFGNKWFTRDDAYYYFKVAQNISEGHGSTFDGINLTNGYHPLWLLVCIPIFSLARFDLILPLRILLLVMSGLSVATGILIYRLLGRIFAPAIGAIMAVYWVFDLQILLTMYQQGLESGIAAFFVILLVYQLYHFEKQWRWQAISRKHLLKLGFIAALTLLSRLDLIFLVTLAGVWIIFRKQPLRYFLPLDMLAIISAVLIPFINILEFPREYYFYANAAVIMSMLALAIKVPLAYLLGLYEPSITDRGIFHAIKQVTLFSISGSVILIPIMLFLRQTDLVNGFPRTALIYDLLLTFLFYSLTRLGILGLKESTNQELTPTTPIETLRANWKIWLNDAVPYYGVVFGMLGIYMLYNKFVFGTFSPVSGQIKRWWATLPGTTYGGTADTLLAFFGLDYIGSSNAWTPVSSQVGVWAENLNRNMTLFDYQRYLIMLTMLVAVFYLLLRRMPQKSKQAITQLGVIPLFAGSYFQIYYYHAIGYSAFKEWYWVAEAVFTTLLLGMILGMLYNMILRFKHRHVIAWVAVMLFALRLGYAYADYVRYTMPYGYWQPDDPYLDVIPFLEESTEPGSLIGITGGGNAGYFIHDRTIINMDGLINSYAYYQALQKYAAGEFLAAEGLNYILARPSILDGQPYSKQFNPYLERTVYSHYGKDLLRFHPKP